MNLDILHHGHINIILEGAKYGDLIIGLLTDRAIASFKRLPYLNYEQRFKIIKSINGVKKVVKQDEWDYSSNLLKYKPDFMIHGDDWLNGPMLPYRNLAIKALESYGGKLIEIPYTKGVSSSAMVKEVLSLGVTSEIRKATLKRLLNCKKYITLL